ncbi:MAG TPA: metalloregulator ArsR/SmtB family transcription factor [Kofleriaceae bacterium]|jgi:DNA-binding transcriptional ArsR family regulator
MVQYAARALDDSFGAISDPTRRGILERLGKGDASISELADGFGMTLTGMKKHIAILEEAKLVSTVKTGRVRTCTLGPRKLEEAMDWIAAYRRMLEERMDHLAAFLEKTRPADEPISINSKRKKR